MDSNKHWFREAALVADEWIEANTTGKNIRVDNPATGELVGYVPRLEAVHVDRALESAHKAQAEWAKQTAQYRASIMHRWYELIMASREDLAQLLTREQGKPLAEAMAEIEYGASFIEWFAQEARRVYGETIPEHREDVRLMVLKQPVGVVAAITPWNFPNAMVTRKVAPALAAGCAVVLKPASQTPFSAIALAALAQKAGLPPGLFSVVTGAAGEIGDVLTRSPIVRKLTFTGSTEIGVELYRQCAPTIKKLGLELGGNAPFIVFDDADLDAAVEGALVAKFRNNGQTCVCANRIYVQEKVYNEFAERFAAAVAKLRTGNGLDPEIQLGPLIDAAAVEQVREYIDDALSHGARALIGGEQSALGGNYFQATVLTGVTPEMKVAKEEIFGPVAPLLRFQNEADVIAQANDTEYGLASYFYARDMARVFRVVEALEYGMVGINTGLISTAEAPFGGMKSSGLGREGSHHGIDDFLELKYVCLGGIRGNEPVAGASPNKESKS